MNIFQKNQNSYPESINRVHEEFLSAGDTLYNESVAVLDNTVANEKKVVRLKNLGFHSSKEVVETQKSLDAKYYAKKRADLIAYYKEKYPFNKFIDESGVKRICAKYGLIYGKVSSYTGFIPENKIAQMEAMKVNPDDMPEVRYDSMSFSFRAPVPKEKTFSIAAPQKDFDLSDGTWEVKEYKITAKPVPDPVVLAPVIGGYLIVCAWGDEASDPLVVNEINN